MSRINLDSAVTLAATPSWWENLSAKKRLGGYTFKGISGYPSRYQKFFDDLTQSSIQAPEFYESARREVADRALEIVGGLMTSHDMLVDRVIVPNLRGPSFEESSKKRALHGESIAIASAILAIDRMTAENESILFPSTEGTQLPYWKTARGLQDFDLYRLTRELFIGHGKDSRGVSIRADHWRHVRAPIGEICSGMGLVFVLHDGQTEVCGTSLLIEPLIELFGTSRILRFVRSVIIQHTRLQSSLEKGVTVPLETKDGVPLSQDRWHDIFRDLCG